MNTFPLAPQEVKAFTQELSRFGQFILEHDKAQNAELKLLRGFVQEALQMQGAKDTIWEEEVRFYLEKLTRDNRDRQNQDFFNKTRQITTDDHVKDLIADTPLESGEMSESDIASHFQETVPLLSAQVDRLKKPLGKMSLEEIDQWEKDQDNSNDIYKVAARVKNLARDGKLSLTPAGEAMCNIFVHMLLELYKFASSVEDKETKVKLNSLIRKQETVPANVISAAMSGVKTK